MSSIEPTKVVKSTTVNKDLNNSENVDSAEARLAWDARLMADPSLAESYRHYPLMRFFGLSDDEKSDDKINDKVKAVYGWAHNKSKSEDPNLIMKVIRFLEMEMGVPPLDNSRLDHMYGAVDIENQMADLENERRYKYGF